MLEKILEFEKSIKNLLWKKIFEFKIQGVSKKTLMGIL